MSRTLSNGCCIAPRRVVTDSDWKWHVWYPLRRKGEFNACCRKSSRRFCASTVKSATASATRGLAQDIRLACFGMDQHDNDFVIGLIGKELYPLSACIQAMRRTQQTAQHMQQMGPFFIGKAIWQKTVE